MEEQVFEIEFSKGSQTILDNFFRIVFLGHNFLTLNLVVPEIFYVSRSKMVRTFWVWPNCATKAMVLISQVRTRNWPCRFPFTAASVSFTD